MCISKATKNIIIAYEKGYRVTESGDVISPKGNILKAYRGKKGYWVLGIRINKRIVNIFVHRFAAYQWFGSTILDTNLVVRHLDGDSTNNRKENLALGTLSENQMDCPPKIRLKRSLIAVQYLRKLSENEVLSLLKDRKNGMLYTQLMKKYNIAKSTVSYIVNRKTYRHIK